jgi:hypothetical protein
MKINEILTEGPLDYLKGLAKTGSLVGAKAASQQAQGQKEINQFANAVFQKWNNYTGQTGDKDIAAWAEKFFGVNNISIVPGDDTAASAKLFLTKVSQDYKAGKLIKGDPSVARKKEVNVGVATRVPGFAIVSKEPIVIRYQKKDYALNNKGEWTAISTRGTKTPLLKDINPTLEKLLDKAAGFADHQTHQTVAQPKNSSTLQNKPRSTVIDPELGLVQ